MFKPILNIIFGIIVLVILLSWASSVCKVITGLLYIAYNVLGER